MENDINKTIFTDKTCARTQSQGKFIRLAAVLVKTAFITNSSIQLTKRNGIFYRHFISQIYAI